MALFRLGRVGIPEAVGCSISHSEEDLWSDEESGWGLTEARRHVPDPGRWLLPLSLHLFSVAVPAAVVHLQSPATLPNSG